MTYSIQHPTREEIDSYSGRILLEFGANFCGHCQAAQNYISQAMQKHPDLKHLKIEDGAGKRLGRSFKIKLWPTLVLIESGKEIGRVVRPQATTTLLELLDSA